VLREPQRRRSHLDPSSGVLHVVAAERGRAYRSPPPEGSRGGTGMVR
jgi:hypothetical protein